jgi:IS605 OrfB family transposase
MASKIRHFHLTLAKAKEVGAAIIVMEDLEIHKKDRVSEELNGRLHRWSYGRFR